MGIIVTLGKERVKQILFETRDFAISNMTNWKYVVEYDIYDDGVVLKCITKKDKEDWKILEDISKELTWFKADRKYQLFHINMPFETDNTCEIIFFQRSVADKLTSFGIKAYNYHHSRD